MALWKARSLSPEQKVEFVEEQSDSKSLISEESGSFLGLDDVSMSEIYSCSLSIPVISLSQLNTQTCTSPCMLCVIAITANYWIFIHHFFTTFQMLLFDYSSFPFINTGKLPDGDI